MSLAYGIIAAIALGMIVVCIVLDKKRDVWLMLLFLSVFICDLGYFVLSVSHTLSAALNANRLSYLGSVFLPFFMLMMILRFCNIRRSRPLMVLLVAVGILVLGIACTPGISTVYYSSVSIHIGDEGTRLLREYGPLHSVYYVYLFAYITGMLGVSAYAIVRKMIRSRSHTICLLLTVLCNIMIWLVEQFLPRGFELLSVSYILTECFVLVLYRSMQKQGTMRSDGLTASYQVNVILALFLLLMSSCLREVTKGTTLFLYAITHVMTLMIYLSILISWGISVSDRVMNRGVRRHLIALVILMIFWLLFRTLRHTVFLYVYPYGMWCWYAYYISMILIPQLCFFAAMYIGRPEDLRISKRWYLLYIPAILLILGILTNDLHQLAFVFHMGYELGWNVYHRSILYYLAAAWMFVYIALMMVQFVMHCRIPGTKKMIWLPIGLLGVGVVYSILYLFDSELFGFIEMTPALCFTVVAIWESCIKTGLVQSNTHYTELLKISGMSVAVVDQAYNVRYASDNVRHMTKEQMASTEVAPLMLDGGIRISSAPIRGGRVLWQEDVSELLAALQTLKDNTEALQDSNTVSMRNYQIDKQIRRLSEINRLHDQLHRQTAKQIDLLEGWLERCRDGSDSEQKLAFLRRSVVVGAYLKRRNNLILLNEQDGVITPQEFSLSLEEMIRDLGLCGVDHGLQMQIRQDIPAQVAMRLLDHYEAVVERSIGYLHSILVRCYHRDGRFYMGLDVECDTDLTDLMDGSVSVKIPYAGAYILTLGVEGGDGA